MTNPPLFQRKLTEKCGVFGIFNSANNAVSLTILGLQALQHRGQEGSGIVAYGNHGFTAHRGLGLVSEVFQPSSLPAKFLGYSAVGHNRYATSGNNGTMESASQNIQPLFVETSLGGVAIAHNGNLTNTDGIRSRLVTKGHVFNSTTDTEVILHLVAESKREGIVSKITEALGQITGAYSLVFLTKNELIGVRDPFGFRPLVLGKIGGSYVLASETCAFDIINAEFIREVAPGEIVRITSDGIEFFQLPRIESEKFCAFEYVYFARPDSHFGEISVGQIRHRMGERLWLEHGGEADMVVDVPDSGKDAALGLAQASGIQYRFGITRSHYIGRNFLLPSQAKREVQIRIKFNPNPMLLKGKRILLVDDSLVRGTTSTHVVHALRKVGVKEVHLRISSPEVMNPCHFGIATPSKEELIAHRMTLPEIAAHLKVDSLKFLSVGGLLESCGRNTLCTGCFTGKYPEAIC